MAAPKITLYTNHRCPWAHRAHIALRESGLKYDEVIIDLDRPRDEWYLKINPRGLVPTIDYNGEIIPESAIVAQFIADAHPSHLVPATGTEGAALKRARIAFFVDTYISKVLPSFFGLIGATDEASAEAAVPGFVEVVKKEIEPLLTNAAPFFGGSDKLTLAEVQTGSFVLRLLSFIDSGLVPNSLKTALEKETPHTFKWANAVVAEESVNFIYDADAVAEGTKKMIGKRNPNSRWAK